VQTIAHASDIICRLDDGDVAIAVIVSWSRAVQHAVSDNLAAFQFHNLVAVFGFAPVSEVHFQSPVPWYRNSPAIA
jgi:hypothetical protein